MALPYVRCFLWSVPVAIATTDLLASVIRIDGQSMAPTLNPDAASTSSPDYVFVEKVSIKWFHQLHRGAVVVLWCVQCRWGRHCGRSTPLLLRRRN